MEAFDLFWVEIDTRDPKALAYIRSRTTIPVAHLPTGPGWGTEVNGEAVRAHPPKKR